MNSLIGGWIVGLGLGGWNDVRWNHMPPRPRRLLWITALFGGLGLIAEASDEAKSLASLLGWGFDIAALLHNMEVPGFYGDINPGVLKGKLHNPNLTTWSSLPKIPDDQIFPTGSSLPVTPASTPTSTAASGTPLSA